MYCRTCGAEMEVYYTGIYNCPSCANRYYEEDDSWEWNSAAEDPFDGEGKPMACISCGDGAYPNCIDECSIMGD